MATVSVDRVSPSFWGPGVISSLALGISIKKVSDSDGVGGEKSLIFSAVCCNAVVLKKP